MKRRNKQPFHATSFTFVPVSPRQPGKGGTMPARHRCPRALSPTATGTRVSQRGRYELAGTTETANCQSTPSAWERQFTVSQLQTAAIRCAGRRKGLRRLQSCRRWSKVFCVRSWAGAEGSALLQKAGNAVCSAKLSTGPSGFLSLMPPRTELLYPLHMPKTRLWPQLVIYSHKSNKRPKSILTNIKRLQKFLQCGLN